MTTTDRRDADDATFAAELARLDRLPVADEGAEGRVARALWDVDHEHLQEFMTGPEIDGFWAGLKSHPEYAKRARAAIAALKPAPGTDGSGRAVQRALELADDARRWAVTNRDLADRVDGSDADFHIGMAQAQEAMVKHLRAAVAGPQRDHGGEGGQ